MGRSGVSEAAAGSVVGGFHIEFDEEGRVLGRALFVWVYNGGFMIMVESAGRLTGRRQGWAGTVFYQSCPEFSQR